MTHPNKKFEESSATQPLSSWPRPLLVTIVAAFVVRLMVYHLADVLTGLPRTPNAPYAWELGNIARSIVTGKGFSSPLPVDSGPTAYLTPVYPYFVALLFKLFGVYSRAAELGIIYFNSAISALTCWPLYHVGKKIRDAQFGLWSARFWAFLPTAIFCPITWLWDASLLAFLVALLFWKTLNLASSSRPLQWAGYGALWSFTAMVNPAPIVLLPFFLGWAVLRSNRNSVTRLAPAILSLVVFAGGISPWMVRNYLVFGRIIPFRSTLGMALDQANNSRSGSSWKNANSPYNDPEERRKYLSEGEIAYSAAAQRSAIQFIRTHPGDYANFVITRVDETWAGPWEPLPNLFPYVGWQKQAEFFLYTCRLFSLAAFVGLWLAYRTRLQGAGLMAISLTIFPIVYYLTLTMLRYRHPIDPIMAVLAAYAVSYPAQVWAARRKSHPAVTESVIQARID